MRAGRGISVSGGTPSSRAHVTRPTQTSILQRRTGERLDTAWTSIFLLPGGGTHHLFCESTSPNQPPIPNGRASAKLKKTKKLLNARYNDLANYSLRAPAQILAVRPRRKVWSRCGFGGEGHRKSANSHGLSLSVAERCC